MQMAASVPLTTSTSTPVTVEQSPLAWADRYDDSHNNMGTCGMLYKCKMCDAVFNSHFCLKIHRKTHTDGNVCLKCGGTFTLPEELREHVRGCVGCVVPPSAEMEGESTGGEDGSRLPGKGGRKKVTDKTNVCVTCGAAFRQYRYVWCVPLCVCVCVCVCVCMCVCVCVCCSVEQLKELKSFSSGESWVLLCTAIFETLRCDNSREDNFV